MKKDYGKGYRNYSIGLSKLLRVQGSGRNTMEHEAEVLRKLLDRGIEVIEGSAINHDDFYSVKESAELLRVSTKTIRNRIQQGTLKAVFHSIGKGQSQYLIPKSEVNTATNTLEVIPLSRSVSLPALTDAIKTELQAENKVLREEIMELRKQQEETNKTLQELIIAIQHGDKNKKSKWQFWK